jgi:hypothetical protein
MDQKKRINPEDLEMLPQHGGVPNFSLRLKGPSLILLALVLITGLMLSFMFYRQMADGDISAELYMKQSLTATLLLCAIILLGSTWRWWHPHLWKHGNSQTRHRARTKGHHDSKRRHHDSKRRRKNPKRHRRR